MILALRRIAFLTIISGMVIGLSWVILLIISRFIPNSTNPIEIGTLLQASAGSFCFAYSITHLRGTIATPRVAHYCEAVGIIVFGITLWILALPHLIHGHLPIRTFALPVQIGQVIGGDCLLTGRLLRRYHARGSQIGVILFGNTVVGILLIYCLLRLWNE